MCFVVTPVLLCLSAQDGESALKIAVSEGHLDVVKLLVQLYRDSHMESEKTSTTWTSLTTTITSTWWGTSPANSLL